jgi:hypothetical protein
VDGSCTLRCGVLQAETAGLTGLGGLLETSPWSDGLARIRRVFALRSTISTAVPLVLNSEIVHWVMRVLSGNLTNPKP